VGEIARLDQTELVAALHDLPADAGRGLQRLAGAEAEMPDEMLEIACVAALRMVGEAVVAAHHDADAAAPHLVVRAATRFIQGFQALELAPALGSIAATQPLEPRHDKADGGAGEDLILGRLELVQRFLVGVIAMVDDVHAVLERALDRSSG